MSLDWALGGAERAKGGHCPGLPAGPPGQEGWLGTFSHLSFQERVNKKQKKAAPSEEDDSGIEVYYREGEDDRVEKMSVLPKVRDSIW